MAVVLAILLASPQIERIDLPCGGFVRSGEWTVAVIHLRSAEPFDGALEVAGDVGTRFRVAVSLPAGGAEAVRVPIVVLGETPPTAVLLEGDREVARRAFPGSWTLIRPVDLLVGIAPGTEGIPTVLPSVRELDGGVNMCLFELPAERWEDSWLYEPVDVLVGGSAEGLGVWKMMGGVHWEDARDLAGRGREVLARRGSRIPLVDGQVWKLAPGSVWSERRRNFVVLFTVLYAFAAFVSLFWVARRGGRAALAAAVMVLVIVFGAAGWLLFPSGRVSLTAHQFEYRHGDGAGASLHVLFASAAVAGKAELRFSRWVRPVFSGPDEAVTTPLVLEFSREGACTVRWETEGAGMLCLLDAADAEVPEMEIRMEADSAPYRVELRSERALRDAEVTVRGRRRSVGDLRAGERRTVEVSEEGAGPPGGDFEFLRAHLFGLERDAFLFARRVPEPAYSAVDSPDLLEAFRTGHSLVARGRE